MKRYRYLVVRHPKSVADKAGIDENGAFINHLPVHHLLNHYHWARMDEDFVLVNGEFSALRHDDIINHEHALVLPSVGSAKSIHKHALEKGKHEHSNALHRRYNIEQGASMSDLLELIEQHEGPLFQPQR